MFTLAQKMRVVNSDSDIKFYDAANAEITTTAGIAGNVERIYINGFGNFNVAEITNIKMRRAVAPAGQVTNHTVVAPAGLAVGEALEVRVYASTTRYQSELKNNYIGRAKPIKFQTAGLAGVTTNDISAAIAAGWTSHKNLFVHADDFFFEIADGTGSIDVTVQPGYESVEITRVDIVRVAQGIAAQSPVTLTKSITTNREEGNGTGKFLEESVRMATWGNENPYGVDNIDSRVDIRGSYTELTFSIAFSDDENLSTLIADHGPLPVSHDFCVYMNESTMLGANASIERMAELVVDLAATLANVTVTVIAAPTSAQELTEGLIFSDRSSVATSAAFIL